MGSLKSILTFVQDIGSLDDSVADLMANIATNGRATYRSNCTSTGENSTTYCTYSCANRSALSLI
jgi:hypothetical protein